MAHSEDGQQACSETACSETAVTLVKGEDRFEAVVLPAPPQAVGTHELRYLWNRRPFLSRVFQRGALDALMASVRELQEELISRGWRLA